MEADLRITCHPALGKHAGTSVRFTFDGRELTGLAGEPIAAALWAAGVRALNYANPVPRPTGIYCGIGHCFSCRVTVDGEANVRSCLTPLRSGMVVLSQRNQAKEGGE